MQQKPAIMDSEEFKKQAHLFVEWMGDYLENITDYPVKSTVSPGEIKGKLSDSCPVKGEDMSDIFKDFREIIMPGVTHWQHPSFHAYFPANSSYPSLLGEMLTAAMGLQCMMWDTSPAAAELEERVTCWLRDMTGLPSSWKGVIQDTASTATLVAILTARERLTDFRCNEKGLFDEKKMRVYCSAEAHSSVDKGVRIAGLGTDNLVKIPVDENLAMKPELLDKAIREDTEKGFLPLCTVAALGTTGTVAVDPVDEIGSICEKYNIWLHIDAAYAGSALILPEYRHMMKGVEKADSFVFNPHKWLFTNFDCSLYFVKECGSLKKTFSITPEYLKTGSEENVNNYRDWGIQLGRRFRALKLWFVLRSFGEEGLQKKLREHISIAGIFKNLLLKNGEFELTSPASFNVICFRWTPAGYSEEDYNELTRDLMTRINLSGKAFLSHTVVKGKYTIRMVAGQTNISVEHIEMLHQLLVETAEEIIRERKGG